VADVSLPWLVRRHQGVELNRLSLSLKKIGPYQYHRLLGNEEWDTSSTKNSLTRKVTTLGLMTEPIAKELNESLCGVIINASTCLRMLAADPPNVEGARETARRTIRASNRAAEAVSRLSTLFNKKK